MVKRTHRQCLVARHVDSLAVLLGVRRSTFGASDLSVFTESCWTTFGNCKNHLDNTTCQGVLAYVVYKGCWCKEHTLCDFAEPRLLQKLGVPTGGGLRHIVSSAAKFCVKLAQDAVAVQTSAFYVVPLFERAAFQCKCLGEPSARRIVAFFLLACVSEQHETAIVAGPQTAGSIDVHTTLEWVDA